MSVLSRAVGAEELTDSMVRAFAGVMLPGAVDLAARQEAEAAARSVLLKLRENPAFKDQAGELRWRLNERLAGRDPGQPINWRGL